MSNGASSAELQDADLLQCVVCSSTLQDAVLLTCLHSVCRSCACDATVSVICPVCRVVTDTSATKANLLVSGLVHRSQVLKSMFSCTYCAAESENGALSVAWCYICQQSLCIDCENYHRRFGYNHTVMRLDESTVLSELYRPPSRMCTIHDAELKLVCFTCRDGRCYKCAHSCYTASHDVQLIGSPAAVDRMKDMITNAAGFISDLNSTEPLLQAHFSLTEKVADTMEESRAVLRNAKKKAIDSISSAYDKAERSLFECCEVLTEKAMALRESAETLKKRLDWTNKYCQVALRTEDMTSLLAQLDELSSCLCSLLDEARKVKQPADPLKLISLNVCLPHDLDLITSDWIGTVTIVSDNYDCSVNDIPNEVKNDYYTRRVSALSELEELIRKHKEQQESLERARLAVEPQLGETRDRRAVQQPKLQLKLREQHLASASSDPPPVQQQHYPFDAASVRVPLPVECCDVALTQGGRRMLLAASEHGLMEFCSTTGREVSRWRPPKLSNGQDDSVHGVAVLSDGRAAAGIFVAQLVVLLRQSETGGRDGTAAGGVWIEVRRFEQLPWSPRRLSAHGDVLAVTDDKWNEKQKGWFPGSRLKFMSVSSGQLLSAELQREYSIRSLAVAARVVVTGSLGKVKLSGGRGDARVLDAHSVEGGDKRLWRYELSNDVNEITYGVCADSPGGCLYAAVLRSDLSSGRVCALSLADGIELQRITLRFDGPKLLPVLLSLSDDTEVGLSEQPTSTHSSCRSTLLLAVLCWDPETKQQRTVTLHRSHRE